MFNKYVRKITEHRIALSGIILIAVGTFLTFIGQDASYRFNDNQLRQTLSQKSSQTKRLVKRKNELLARIDEDQKKLTEKDETIQLLQAHISKLNVPATKQSEDEQIDISVDKPDIIAPEQHADKQIEADIQVVPDQDLHDIILQAKNLCVEGKNDEAYRVVDNLRQKHPDFGSAYFMLGTIEMYREHYVKGEALLNRAIQLGLPDDDMAWAYHNLGYSLLQKEDFEKAKGFLEKAVEFNPEMEESKKALKLLGEIQ